MADEMAVTCTACGRILRVSSAANAVTCECGARISVAQGQPPATPATAPAPTGQNRTVPLMIVGLCVSCFLCLGASLVVRLVNGTPPEPSNRTPTSASNSGQPSVTDQPGAGGDDRIAKLAADYKASGGDPVSEIVTNEWAINALTKSVADLEWQKAAAIGRGGDSASAEGTYGSMIARRNERCRIALVPTLRGCSC